MSWQLGSTALVAVALVAGVAWYERSKPPSRLVALVAALAGLALAGRVVFTPIPNVQATTDIVLLSGYALGPLPGFVVGATGALASNFFLGQGPWTPWQMLGWGMAGVGGGALAAVFGQRLGRASLALACAAAGFAFGAWMDLFTVMVFTAEHSARSYMTVAGVSLPFNVAHATGNAVLCLVFGPGFVRMLARFRRRMQVEWVAVASLLVLCLLAASALASQPSLRYLERAQNADGGFGGAPGTPSSQLLTGWAAIGLEAAGRNPLDVRKGRRSPIDYTRANLGELRDPGDLERTILVLEGAGLDARRFGNRNLVAELLRHRDAQGSFEHQANWTAFGVLALRAAGRPAKSATVQSSARWLARQQNSDGGFSFATRGGGSFVDETGAALQGLAAAGMKNGDVVRRALAYLRRAQNSDGGFGQSEGYRSNAQSTAWAIQGLVATGASAGRFGHKTRSPLEYLASLRSADGSYRYSRSSAQTPVWVTAQAIAAARRKPFPLRAVPRARKRPARRAREPARARAKPRVARKPAARRPAPPSRRPRPAPAVRRVAGTQRRHRTGDDGGIWPVVGTVAVALALTGGVVAFKLKGLSR
jgi:energy-coupling factor transport system substrate-specific component